MNLDFYGIGGKSTARKVGYNLDGLMSMQQVLHRLGEASNFVGAALDLSRPREPVRSRTSATPGSRRARSRRRAPASGSSLEHDSRDNIFTPNRGWTGSLDTMFYSPDFGSDHTLPGLSRATSSRTSRHREAVRDRRRVDGRAARGDVPFYQLPFIDMRGIPAARYQDENTGVIETEVRWNVTPRWSLIGFIGAARAWGTDTSFKDSRHGRRPRAWASAT